MNNDELSVWEIKRAGIEEMFIEKRLRGESFEKAESFIYRNAEEDGQIIKEGIARGEDGYQNLLKINSL